MRERREEEEKKARGKGWRNREKTWRVKSGRKGRRSVMKKGGRGGEGMEGKVTKGLNRGGMQCSPRPFWSGAHHLVSSRKLHKPLGLNSNYDIHSTTRLIST